MELQCLREESVLKIRIKFSKNGPIRYIGHLDVMRYFQKLNRRANIDVKYSAGFSPHQIMSFAAPLGVGLESMGEYVDIEVNTTMSSADSVASLNAASVEGIQVISYVKLDDNAANAMSLVAAADYKVTIKDNYLPNTDDIKAEFNEFLAQKSIIVEKASKKSVREVDLRPLIYDAYIDENGAFFMKLSTGSVENLKPELVMDAFYKYLGCEMSEFALNICRLEVYGLHQEKDGEGNIINEELIPLEKFGEIIE